MAILRAAARIRKSQRVNVKRAEASAALCASVGGPVGSGDSSGSLGMRPEAIASLNIR